MKINRLLFRLVINSMQLICMRVTKFKKKSMNKTKIVGRCERRAGQGPLLPDGGDDCAASQQPEAAVHVRNA